MVMLLVRVDKELIPTSAVYKVQNSRDESLIEVGIKAVNMGQLF